MPADISTAIAATHPNPSPAQREAGNYRKGKVRLHGLLISIENPKGTRRRPEWKPLAAHYGYINRTEGRDGDHVDVYLGPNLRSELVFVIDQVTESGKRFDEHKAILGCVSKAQAKRLYLANYQPGWKCGPITAMTIEQFKTWLAKGDTTRRVAEQVSRYNKSQGMPAPAPTPTQNVSIQSATHQVGETKSINGKTYRLNENSRWERANPDQPGQQQSGPATGGGPQQQVAAKPKILSLKSDGAPFTDNKGAIDQPKFSDHIAKTAQKHIEAGDSVTLLINDLGKIKRVPIVNAEYGKMKDAKGQTWGSFGMLTSGDQIEIQPKQQPNPTEGSNPSAAEQTAEPPAADPSAIDQQQPESEPPQEPPPNPANDHTARHGFVASRLKSVHPEIGGLIRAIHESPSYQSSGEYVSFDVHKRVAADLHSTLTKHAGKEMAGGNVVDLGEGRMGFASEAGSIVVWPADKTGRHQISYTNKTGIVGRAMAAGGPDINQGGGNDETQVGPAQALGTAANPFQAELADGGARGEQQEQEPEAPPLPQQFPGGGESPFRQPPKPQQAPSPAPGGKSPDEQAYDDDVGAPKERPAHVLLRRRANDSREKFTQAHDAYEQAVYDRENPKRIAKLKRQAVHLRQIANEHHRQASREEGEHKARLRESGKATKERMKALGIGPYKPKEKPVKPPKAEKPAKEPKQPKEKAAPAEKPAPLLDQAEKKPGGDVPTASPEALAAAKEMGKLPKTAQLAGAAAQTYLKHSGLSVTPENHKVIQHAIKSGWVKDKKELRTLLKRAKAIHAKGSTHDYQELRGIKDPKERGRIRSQLTSTDHAALKDAIRRKANRERRESWAKIVKQKADHWEMPAKEFHDTASQFYREFSAPLQEREEVKRRLRQVARKNKADISNLENRGGKDSDALSKINKPLQQIANEHKELFEGKDSGEVAWELLREGAKRVPGKTSEDFMQKFEEALSNGYTLNKSTDLPPMNDEELENYRNNAGKVDISIPFAKTRKGSVVVRY